MTDKKLDQTISDWLEAEAPGEMPDRILRATFKRTRATRQSGGWRMLPRTPSMPRFMPALAGAAIVLVVATVALGIYFNLPNVAVQPSPTPSPTATSPQLFTDLAPGEMVDIPDWPLGERTSPPSVWTGTDLIAWGDGIYGSADDGAAFTLANGTWRVIAEAPLSSRGEPAVAWTGTEMLVWGGRLEDSFFYDGAAYNPATDSWRRLPTAGAFFGKDPRMLWTGKEAVVFGVGGDSDTGSEFIIGAAYDPLADSWRDLAAAPVSVRLGSGLWWTGDSIVLADVGYDPESDFMARYEWAEDRWIMLDAGASAAVVGVPESSGLVSEFINLPSETGLPVRVIDETGNLIAELPAFPGDPDVFGNTIGASGLWVGDEALFEIWNDGAVAQPQQIWALNRSTQTWRRLDVDTAFPRIDDSVRVAGDLLLTWNKPTDPFRGSPRVCCVAPPSKGGVIYRVGTTSPTDAP